MFIGDVVIRTAVFFASHLVTWRLNYSYLNVLIPSLENAMTTNNTVTTLGYATAVTPIAETTIHTSDSALVTGETTISTQGGTHLWPPADCYRYPGSFWCS